MARIMEYFGRMKDPTSTAYLKGPCGDAMEFFLRIENDTITAITYYTEGCGITRACGEATARLAHGKSLHEALHISAGEVMDSIENLPLNHLHCSILAVSVFYRAIANYLLTREAV